MRPRRSERLQTFQLRSPSLDPATDEYRQALISRESQHLLPIANEPPVEPGDVVYMMNRTDIGRLAVPLIKSLCASASDSVNVLEIGGGQGKALLYILNDLRAAGLDSAQLRMSMTNLNPLPEHEELRDNGVNVITGVVAEQLPDDWCQKYDVILSMCLLGWTRMEYAMANIRFALKNQGMWHGLESIRSCPVGSTYPYEVYVPAVMEALNMENATTRQDRWKWRQEGYNYFSYLKSRQAKSA